MLNKIDKALTVLEIAVSGVICAAMLIVTCMIVIWRYILVQPLPWGEEAARYLMIWFVFIGCPLAAKGENHLGVEAFVNMLPKHAKSTCIKIMYLLSALMFLVLFALSCKMFMHYVGTDQVSTMLRIPMQGVYACVPIGLLVSGWHYFIHFIHHLHDQPEIEEVKA